ncbi:NAD(P)-dependent oxidoreductase [Devosia sp. BK]|uniref:NAD-dependent epimerase/dehydratase family protein n=1 Tax=Devosia sp. BK TaxID=2871706 RepID=UPI00293B44DB|nr:NAD(P)-dependent oxidoreductase [Devosia sp. BK]MDV3251079.1 NAD(P)-dependent oxidoreductase [Devosia sp. BK]
MTRCVLITGGGGFVGSHLAQGFKALGDAVFAADRLFDTATRQRLAGVDLIEGDLLSGEMALPHADLVIHGAAITTPAESDAASEDALLSANIALTNRVLRHAIDSGAKDFVFISSSGVFSATDGDSVHLESTAPTADLPYAKAKHAGEDAATAATELRAISIRLGPIYGPDERPRDTRTIVSPIRRWLNMALSGEPIIVDMPAERRDWTFAPDLALALDTLLHKQPSLRGVFHLTSGQSIANIDLARMIADLVPGARIVIGDTTRIERLPMASDRLDLSALYEWTTLPTGLARILSAEARA